jgi:ferredoxin-nitrite reductase
LLAEISKERNKKQNQIEELKAKTSFKEAYERLSYYAEHGYESISEDDKKFTLKSFGIFDRPATPGLFMLRIRIPSGRLNIQQTGVLAKIAKKYAKNYIDITTRAQIELRYIRIEDIPNIISTLSAVGISTFQTGVDNFRNIVCDPLNGYAYDSYLDTSAELLQIQNIFLGEFDWVSALPRKFNIAINGSSTNRCNVFGQDLGFTLAIKDGVYGYNVYLGGKVGAAAQNADIFVKYGEATKFFTHLANFYREFGFRDNRNKNRLKYMIDAVGMEKFRSELEEFANDKFEKSGKTISLGDGGDNGGKMQLKDGSFAYLLAVPSGIMSGDKLFEYAQLCKKSGGHSINFTVEQNIYAIGVDGDFGQKVQNTSIFHTNLIACAGTEHCPFGVIPNKPDAIECADYLESRFGNVGGKIRQYWSACPKGCGIHGLGDIGVVGTKVARNKEVHLGVDIYIGGSMKSQDEGKLLVKGALLTEAKEYIAEAIELYLSDKQDKESFEEYFKKLSLGVSSQCVSFAVRLNVLLHKNGLSALKLKKLEQYGCGKKEEAEIYAIGRHLYEAIFGSQPQEKSIFTAIIKGERPKAQKQSIDISAVANLGAVVANMVTPSTYQVFSEIASELGI